MHRNKWVIGVILAVFFGSIWSLWPPEKKLKLGLDLRGGMHLILEVDEAKLPKGIKLDDVVDRAIEIIRNRIDQLGVSEPYIQKEGSKWIVVQLPGIKDPEEAKKLIGETALLEFKLVDEEGDITKAEDGKVPEGDELLYDRENHPILIKKETLMTGAELENAQVKIGDGALMNEPYVSFQMTPEGGKKFAKITGANIKKRLAIILDGKVYSAPVIQDRIRNSGQITGSFDMKEAQRLAIVLRSGSLPAPLNIISENVVGPTLGTDSINKGKRAGIIGIVAIILLMAFYYRLSGIIADIGLLCNLLYLIGAMCALESTFTMPGIAGIILTMGMSVDSNVLIFERIREELRAGKTVRAAIEAGYNRALITIIDSHVTTLITSVILFQFGTGPIRGFAVTLSLGVLISLFTAIVVTRVIFDWRMARGEVNTLSI